MAKRQKLRTGLHKANKELQREETASLELPKVPTAPVKEIVLEETTISNVVPESVVVTPKLVEYVKVSKKIARNYNYEGELLEKFDAILWHRREMATTIMNDALNKAMKSISKEEMAAAMKAYHGSKDYKKRGEEYYYKFEEK